MSQDKEKSKAEIYLDHLVRGGIKSVPALGPLLEEFFYGSMDEVAASEQAAKVMAALGDIQSGVDVQSMALDGVLEQVNVQVGFMAEVAHKLDELVAGLRALGTASIPKALEQSVERVLKRLPGALPPIWNLQNLRNPNFTGRDSLLESLHEVLTSGRQTAVTAGLGGVGKTQLATEYAYGYASDYEAVWWVRSEEAASLAADYAALAGELGLPEKDAAEQSVAVEAVRRWLEQNRGWLLVLDNVPGPAEVRDYIPRGETGHVLITSRNQAWGNVATPLPVEVFERPESVEFLLRRTGETDEKTANALAEALGDLPLALEQAAAYVEETGRPLAGYLQMFTQHQSQLLDRHQESMEYPRSVATVFEISCQAVREASPEAADLLGLIAFLAPDDIPRSLLTEGVEHLPGPLKATVSDSLAMDGALSALRRYSLVEVTGESLAVHRLVQAVARDFLNEDEKKASAEAAVGLINAAFPYEENVVETWAGSARLLPHALATAGHAETFEVGLEATARLLNQVGLYQDIRAEFSEAKTVLERAVRMAEAAYGPDHPTVATGVNNLGGVLQALGDLEGARTHYQRALAIDEGAYGPDHPDVAVDVNNLGMVLRDLGDLEGARAHFQRALAIDEGAYGPDHPTVAIRVNNLGLVLRDLGDLEGARAHLERALAIGEATYGPDHPTVATGVNNLGGVLQAMGDLEGARAHLERALAINEAAYGPDHPNVAIRVNNLGGVLRDMGDFEGARAHYQRALRIFQQFLGDDHPNTVTVRNHLRSLDAS